MVYLALPASVLAATNMVAVNTPLSPSFSHPISSVRYTVVPTTNGTWHVSRNLLHGITGISFAPAQQLLSSQRYAIKLNDMRTAFGISMTAKTIQFITNKLQPVKLTSPALTNASIQSVVAVSMASQNNGVRNLELTSSDAKIADATPTTTDGRLFSRDFASSLAQGTTYYLKI